MAGLDEEGEMMKQHARAFILIMLPLLASNAWAQSVSWKQVGNALGFGIQCGYFWNRGEGVVATGAGQIYYLRSGVWRTGLKLPYGSVVNSIRCFNGKTLYAPVLNRFSGFVYQLWQSNDSGSTWTETSLHSASLGVDGADVYWNYWTNSPVMMGSTDVRLDSLDMISTFDYWGQGPPLVSSNGGRSWQFGPLIDSIAGYNYYSGFGACADLTNKIYYASSESGYPGAFRSVDSGRTWTCVANMPTSLYMLDDIEGIYDKTFIQTNKGLYETTDSGSTWDFIGGPVRRTSDDARFCVFGCTGQAVAAFGDDGSVWIDDGGDAPDPAELRSTFDATPKECDTTIITITVNPDFALWPLLLSIDEDSGSHFRLLTSDTIEPDSSAQQIRIAFTAQDLVKHSAQLSMIPLGFEMCPMSRTLYGQAHLLPPKVIAPRPILTCAQVSGKIQLTNSNCEPLLITLDSSNSPNLVTLPFDSVVTDTAELPFICPPEPLQGFYSYWTHIHGHFEPSGVPFDTTLWTTVQYGYVPSRLEASAYILDLGTVSACTSVDTTIAFENPGCDTLLVPMRQSLKPGWSITPDNDTLRLVPGDIDSVAIHFSAAAPGYYPEGLTYIYLGRSSGTVDFAFSATVAPALPTAILSDTGVDLGTRSICANDTTLEISITNSSCDSIVLSDYRLDAGALFYLLDPGDTILPPNGTAQKLIAYHADEDTEAIQSLTIHISRTDGSLGYDTAVTFSANVTGMRKQLASSNNAIDVGQTYVCQERDTFVVIQDTGCDSVCISQLSLSGTGFSIAPVVGGRIVNDTPAALCLAPGESDTIWLGTRIDTSAGTTQNNDTLFIASDAASPLAPIPLSREIAYPVTWAAGISAPATGKAGTEVSYNILQAGNLPSDITQLNFRLSYEDDLLGYLGADQSSVTPGVAVRDASGLMHQSFRISPVPAGSILATLHFYPYVARKAQTAITLDSIRFVSALDRPDDCIASVDTAESAFTLVPECGTDLLTQLMQTGTIQLESIDPNPSQGRVTVSIYSGAKQAMSGELSIADAIGRIVLEQNISLAMGENRVPLYLASLPSGLYAVRLIAAGCQQTREFIRQ